MISDQHYSQREREGRHVTFMARMIKDFNLEQPKGIGVDEKTALCIDQDGKAYAYGTNSVYILISEPFVPEQCAANKPLTFDADGKAIRAYIYKASAEGTLVYNLKENPPGKPDELWSVKNGVLIRKKG